jgi:hypothetical protein
MNSTQPDAKFLKRLRNATLMAELEKEADGERVIAHQRAVDALLEHDAAAAGEQNKLLAEIEAAVADLAPLELRHREAVARVALAHGETRRGQYAAELRHNQLESETRRHLPEFVGELERDLVFVESDIRAGAKVREIQPTYSGGQRTFTSNTEEVRAALSQAKRVRCMLAGELMQPRPLVEIESELKKAAIELVRLARIAGADVAYHLPEPLRTGPAVKPERERGRIMV